MIASNLFESRMFCGYPSIFGLRALLVSENVELQPFSNFEHVGWDFENFGGSKILENRVVQGWRSGGRFGSLEF